MSYSSTGEKVKFSFSLKNCLKGFYYSISILIEDLSSKYKDKFSTEEIKCLKNNTEINFSKIFNFTFHIEKVQRVVFKIIKRSQDFSEKYDKITSISNIISSPNAKYERIIEKSKDKEILCVMVDRANNNFEEKYLFYYFKSGVKLSCFISLDFSNSINNPTLIDTKENYIGLLKNISYIESYINNHIYYSYGYGGTIFGFSKDETNFNLDFFKNECSIKNINGVIQLYEECFKPNIIIPSNTIILSPLIRKITKEIYNLYEVRYYNVSFIITRGILDKSDIKDTIDSIIESSYLPLTTFIIGVGKNDYSQMMKIFNKRHKASSIGMQKMRDNIYFVSLVDNFSNNSHELISWCLTKLSQQIMSYYDLIKVSPQNIYDNNLKNIKDSFNIFNSSVILDRSNVSESEINEINSKASILIQSGNSSQNKSIEVSQEESKEKNIDEMNPYKLDRNLGSSCDSNKKNNNSNSSINSDKEKKLQEKIFKGIKVEKYKDLEDTGTDKGENENYFIPQYKNSINEKITEINPYGKKDIENDTQNGPAPSAIEYRNYQIPSNSIIEENEDKKMSNPFSSGFKGKDSENIGGSNYSIGIKKNNKISNGSEFNSTKNSENIKTSNSLGFNNYSIYNTSHLK